MLVSHVRHLPSARRALDEPFFNQERLIHLFHRSRIFPDGRGDGRDAYRSALELIDNGKQNLVVYLVQSVTVDIQCLQRITCDGHVHPSRAAHLGKIAHAAQKRIGDTGRSTAAPGNLHGGIVLDGYGKDVRRTFHDARKHLGVIILQMQVDAETGTEGSGKQTAARSGTHQREGIQVELYAACRRAFVYHDVYPVVLHGGIKILLHYGTEPVDFVDEEHVVRLQRSQDTGQIARLVQYRAGRDLETHAQFVGYDVAQRGLPQSRRTVQQSMVEGLAPVLGSLDENFQVFHHLQLSAEIPELERTQGILELALGRRV